MKGALSTGGKLKPQKKNSEVFEKGWFQEKLGEVKLNFGPKVSF